MKEKADPGKKSHKKKTKHNQVHKKPTPRSQAKEFLKRGTVGEYSTCLRRSQGAGIREQGIGSRE
jgi:hypothetical protein